MRRVLSIIIGLGLIGSALVGGSSHAAASQETQFEFGIIAQEGPPAHAGKFTYGARLVAGDFGSDTPVASVQATLQVRPYGTTDYVPAATATTDENGQVWVEVSLRRTSQLRWSFAGNSEYAATTSNRFFEVIGTRVRAGASTPAMKRRQRLVVTGRTGTHKAGQRVSLWRGDKPAFLPDLEMTRLAAGRVGPDGTFRLATRFHYRGSKRLYVKVNAGHGNGVGYSRYFQVRVR